MVSTAWFWIRYATWFVLEWVTWQGRSLRLFPPSWAWWAQHHLTEMYFEKWNRRTEPRDTKELILLELEKLEDAITDEIYDITTEIANVERGLLRELEGLEDRILAVEHKLAIEDALDYVDPDPDPTEDPRAYVDPALIEAYSYGG